MYKDPLRLGSIRMRPHRTHTALCSLRSWELFRLVVACHITAIRILLWLSLIVSGFGEAAAGLGRLDGGWRHMTPPPEA